MEFKGTNNELEIRGNQLFLKDSHISILTAHVRKKNLLDFNTEDIEQKANLLLWSKAPEILEMLVELKRRIDIVQTEPNGLVRETMINNLDLGIDILIKQATKI